MSENQLDFLHIFDQPTEPEKKEEDEVIDEEKDREGVLKIEKEQEREQKNLERQERMGALLRLSSPSPEEFEEFMPMILEYAQRLEGIRKQYQEATEQSQRSHLYEILLWPNVKDAVDYQAAASLYMKFKEAESRSLAEQRASVYVETFRKRRSPKKQEVKRRSREIDLHHGKNAAARLAD